MKKASLPFLLVSLLTLASCGPEWLLLMGSSSSSSSKKESSKVEAQNPRQLEITQYERVKFTRKKQDTIYYDCNGHVTSREVVTLNHNNMYKNIIIKYENRKKAYSYEIYNRRTKSTKMGFSVRAGEFVVNIEHTTFHNKVKEGINDIEYTFYGCSQYESPTSNVCKEGAKFVEKEGIVQIEVLHEERIEPGTREVRPPESQCNPKPQ